jgi:heme/copper-type cytochrome/quinol oxidase subunit 2
MELWEIILVSLTLGTVIVVVLADQLYIYLRYRSNKRDRSQDGK